MMKLSHTTIITDQTIRRNNPSNFFNGSNECKKPMIPLFRTRFGVIHIKSFQHLPTFIRRRILISTAIKLSVLSCISILFFVWLRNHRIITTTNPYTTNFNYNNSSVKSNNIENDKGFEYVNTDMLDEKLLNTAEIMFDTTAKIAATLNNDSILLTNIKSNLIIDIMDNKQSVSSNSNEFAQILTKYFATKKNEAINITISNNIIKHKYKPMSTIEIVENINDINDENMNKVFYVNFNLYWLLETAKFVWPTAKNKHLSKIKRSPSSLQLIHFNETYNYLDPSDNNTLFGYFRHDKNVFQKNGSATLFGTEFDSIDSSTEEENGKVEVLCHIFQLLRGFSPPLSSMTESELSVDQIYSKNFTSEDIPDKILRHGVDVIKYKVVLPNSILASFKSDNKRSSNVGNNFYNFTNFVFYINDNNSSNQPNETTSNVIMVKLKLENVLDPIQSSDVFIRYECFIDLDTISTDYVYKTLKTDNNAKNDEKFKGSHQWINLEKSNSTGKNWYLVASETKYLPNIAMNIRQIRRETPSFMNGQSLNSAMKLNVTPSSSDDDGSKPMNILLLGIDSVSHALFQEYMIQTQSVLRRWRTDNIAFGRQNKLGLNTFPNLMALLTGQFTNLNTAKPFDHYPFVWKAFAAANYTTMFVEDSSDISTFSYHKPGFTQAPVDFYSMPLSIQLGMGKRSKKQAQKLTPEEIISESDTLPLFHYFKSMMMENLIIKRYTTNMIEEKVVLPYFALVFTASLTHDSRDGVKVADPFIAGELDYLFSQGLMNDTLLIMFSDHGLRFGDFRKTYQGMVEDFNPFLVVSVPNWFGQEHLDRLQNLQENSGQLVTALDIHATIIDALNMSLDYKFDNYVNESILETQGGQSLMSTQLTLANRTCANQRIPIYYCLSSWQHLATESKSTDITPLFLYNANTINVLTEKIGNLSKIAGQKTVKYIKALLVGHEHVCNTTMWYHQTLELFVRPSNKFIHLNEKTLSFVPDYVVSSHNHPASFSAEARWQTYNNNHERKDVLYENLEPVTMAISPTENVLPWWYTADLHDLQVWSIIETRPFGAIMQSLIDFSTGGNVTQLQRIDKFGSQGYCVEQTPKLRPFCHCILAKNSNPINGFLKH